MLIKGWCFNNFHVKFIEKNSLHQEIIKTKKYHGIVLYF